jgi:hypothetical protein
MLHKIKFNYWGLLAALPPAVLLLALAPVTALAQSGGGGGGGSNQLPVPQNRVKPDANSSLTDPMWRIVGIGTFLAALACLLIGAWGVPKLANAAGSEHGVRSGNRDRAIWQIVLGFGGFLVLFLGTIVAILNGAVGDIFH